MGWGIKTELLLQLKIRDKISDLNRRIGGWKEGMDPFMAPLSYYLLLSKNGLTLFTMVQP